MVRKSLFQGPRQCLLVQFALPLFLSVVSYLDLARFRMSFAEKGLDSQELNERKGTDIFG